MNIIYRLTNLTNYRKYIGQKVECTIQNIDGIDTIINNKTGLPYYGSSSNVEMNRDLSIHKFKAEILEVVKDRKLMCQQEDYWIRKYNAVEDRNYYNLTYPLHYNKRDFQSAVRNEFGELYKEYSINESSIARRASNAKKLGFKTLTDFYIDVYDRIKEQKVQNLAEIARSYNVERHTISRLVQDVNLDKFIKEIDVYSSKTHNKIVELRSRGASIKKIGELLNLEFATITYYIGTNKISKQKDFLVSKNLGYTEDELGYKIMDLVLKGNNIRTAGIKLGLKGQQAQRSFYRFLRKKVEINDFN